MDRHKIKNDLADFFIQYCHRQECVPMTAGQFNKSEEDAIQRYRNDVMFHARIQMIVACVMDIINKEG